VAEKKVYLDSGFTNKVKKTSDKSPDFRINLTLSTDTLDAIIAAGGKMQLAGWNVDYGKGETTNWKASADTFVPKTQITEEIESDIPF
jgi:Neuraminidase (sialidase)